MLILIRLLGYVAVIFGCWVVFLALPCWLLGLSDCREASCWARGQRVKKYIELKSQRWAALWIARWSGKSTKLCIDIPLLYDRYWLNPYPQRLSLLGLVDWCVTLPLLGWYLFALTRFFLDYGAGGSGLLYALAALILRTVVMSLVIARNRKSEEESASMTRRERRQWKRAYRWAKKGR